MDRHCIEDDDDGDYDDYYMIKITLFKDHTGHFADTDALDDCAICHEAVQRVGPPLWRCTACRKVLHYGCMARVTRCPLCRADRFAANVPSDGGFELPARPWHPALQ